MFAIIKAGARQLKVSHNQLVRVERLQAEPGANVTFPVMLVAGPVNTHIGSPVLARVELNAEVVKHIKAEKVIIFKKRRRKNFRRKRGFRAQFTLVRIGRLSGLDESWGSAAEAAAQA
ncbi:MAG: 50S ribosomal protein L21 [Myxococcota bacterium]